jgi:hypothetical protein
MVPQKHKSGANPFHDKLHTETSVDVASTLEARRIRNTAHDSPTLAQGAITS